jgi:hypothetical protein
LSTNGVGSYSWIDVTAGVSVNDAIIDGVTVIAPSQNAVFDALILKAPIASPTFTGTVSGITKAMVGLTNVDDTSDADKPVSTATQTALDLKEAAANKSTDGTLATNSDDLFPTEKAVKTYVDAIAASGVADASTSAAGKIQLTGDLAGTATAPTVPGLTLKAPIADPAFTGTVSGVTSAMVGLGNLDNTSDANKPVSTATQTALDLKENIANKSIDVTLADNSNVKFPTELAVKTYVDNATAAINTLADGKIYLGDGTNQAAEVTMSGALTIDNAGATTIADGAVTNTKLDKANIPLSGFGAASADVALGSNKLTGVADPISDQDAATKAYVDAVSAGINTLAAGKIYLGDVNGAAQEVAMTGDVTIDNAGVTAIGTDKVLTGNILDGTIVVGDLASDAVETDKIKNANVTTEKIDTDAVTTDKIAAEAVDKNKINADVAGTGLSQNADGSLELTVPTYSVGTLYPELGGYVIEVNAAGTHGLVIESQSQGTLAITVFDFGRELISKPSNHSSDGADFFDWRLPSTYELKNLACPLVRAGTIPLSGAHWTSQNYTGTATIVDFNDASCYSGGSSGTQNIISVRSF